MPALGRRHFVVVLLVAAGVFAGSQALISHSGQPGRPAASPSSGAPKSIEEIDGILNADASKSKFNGAVHGWRLAPGDVLEAEGINDRNLQVDCDAVPAGGKTPTQLDFIFSYLPPGITIGNVAGPAKWICGGRGLSVAYDYNVNTPYGEARLWAERAVWGRRSLAVFAAADRVEAGAINGRTAIFIHPADDESGLGVAQIIVIEDDTPPEFTILRISTDNGIPFAELIKIAEGIR